MATISKTGFLALAAMLAAPFQGFAAVRESVLDRGADPTGASDSTDAVQQCIDSVAAAGGGDVVVPPGEYRIRYLVLRSHVRLELAGGAGRATEGWTDEARLRATDPSRSAIIRSVENRDRTRDWWLFLYNLVPPDDPRNGFGDIAVSGGVFDCEGRCMPGAFACGSGIRLENIVVKDLPNDHAFQLNGCSGVVVTNCIFAGYTFDDGHKVLTRETIQVEQTSPGAITGGTENTPIVCPKDVAIPNSGIEVSGCWFGPSERLGPHLIPLGHHGTPRSCNGLVFSGNVVVEPLYCGLRLANVSDVLIEGNTFVSTAARERLADDSAIVCLWGGAALKADEKGVTVGRNDIRLGPGSPLRRRWVSSGRKNEISKARISVKVTAECPSVAGCRRFELTRGAGLDDIGGIDFDLPKWVDRVALEDGEIVVYTKPNPFFLRMR